MLAGTAGILPALLFAAAIANEQPPSCASAPPWGMPTVTDGAATDIACHAGYVSAVDRATKEVRWVAYELTGPHTLGCFPRTGLTFKVDPLVPAEDQGRASDYAGSGYDLGHMAPNEDFAWDADEQRDTFSMANVAPQLPGLNRQGWERGEEYVRAWALARGDVEVYVGPVMAPTMGAIGADKLPVPSAFFKVVVDRRTAELVDFVMPQKAIAKGELSPWLSSLADVEAAAHVTLPVPSGAREAAKPWDADLSIWRVQHRKACP